MRRIGFCVASANCHIRGPALIHKTIQVQARSWIYLPKSRITDSKDGVAQSSMLMSGRRPLCSLLTNQQRFAPAYPICGHKSSGSVLQGPCSHHLKPPPQLIHMPNRQLAIEKIMGIGAGHPVLTLVSVIVAVPIVFWGFFCFFLLCFVSLSQCLTFCSLSPSCQCSNWPSSASFRTRSFTCHGLGAGSSTPWISLELLSLNNPFFVCSLCLKKTLRSYMAAPSDLGLEYEDVYVTTPDHVKVFLLLLSDLSSSCACSYFLLILPLLTRFTAGLSRIEMIISTSPPSSIFKATLEVHDPSSLISNINIHMLCLCVCRCVPTLCLTLSLLLLVFYPTRHQPALRVGRTYHQWRGLQSISCVI